MLVEVFLASLALYVWLWIEPGTIRAICYNTMLIAGISTIIFNCNPLLRFDGYYILCDLIEIQISAGAPADIGAGLSTGGYLARKWRSRAQPQASECGFIVYAPLTFAYRASVVLAISVFIANRYLIVGVAIALWAVFLGLVWPLLKAIAYVIASPSLERQRMRALGSLSERAWSWREACSRFRWRFIRLPRAYLASRSQFCPCDCSWFRQGAGCAIGEICDAGDIAVGDRRARNRFRYQRFPRAGRRGQCSPRIRKVLRPCAGQANPAGTRFLEASLARVEKVALRSTCPYPHCRGVHGAPCR